MVVVHCPPSGRFPGFVKCFLGVPQLVFSFPAAMASKENSHRIVYKTCELTWWRTVYTSCSPSFSPRYITYEPSHACHRIINCSFSCGRPENVVCNLDRTNEHPTRVEEGVWGLHDSDARSRSSPPLKEKPLLSPSQNSVFPCLQIWIRFWDCIFLMLM